MVIESGGAGTLAVLGLTVSGHRDDQAVGDGDQDVGAANLRCEFAPFGHVCN
jgi:hypothetical protein